ncbi:MAG: hypothetical protein WCB59_11030, partial [Candidatus Sulfotelmatobacter sp.]
MAAMRLSALLLLATLVSAQTAQLTTSAKQEGIVAQPKLPTISFSACPGKGRVVPHWKISHQSKIYSSWSDDRTEIGTIGVRDEVTIVGGAGVTRSPDEIVVKKPIPDISLQPGDIILRYWYYADGVADIWAKGAWHD